MINLLQVKYPLISEFNPIRIEFTSLDVSMLEELRTDWFMSPEYQGLFQMAQNIGITPSNFINVALIDNKYYIRENGTNYFAATMSLSGKQEIKCRLHIYPKLSTMEAQFYTMYGVMMDEYLELMKQQVETAERLRQTLGESYNIEDYIPNPLSSNFEEALISYMSGPEELLSNYIGTYHLPVDQRGKYPQIPLLLGHTGAGKSAIVEKVVRDISAQSKYGVRLITIKGGFFDKSDLMGYVEVNEETGLAEDAPNKDLLTATDQFVNACRIVVDRTEAQLLEDNPNYSWGGDVRMYMSIENAEEYMKIREYAKTPVLFFDEINRIDSLVLRQLMVIINQKRLSTYEWQNAPMVAAANWTVGKDKDKMLEELQNIYQVEQGAYDDLAIVDRFQGLDVEADDPGVINGFKEAMIRKFGHLPNNFIHAFFTAVESQWASGNSNTSPWYDVTALKHGVKNAEDLDSIQEKNKFPTFRGWEFLLTYIASKLHGIENYNKPEDAPVTPAVLLSRTMVQGLLGSSYVRLFNEYNPNGGNTANLLNTQLVSQGVHLNFYVTGLNKEGDVQQELLDESMDAGIPAMIMGRFGIGKTAKVYNAAEAHGGEVYPIDLSSQDRTIVRGYPSPNNLIEVAIGNKGRFSQELIDVARNIPGFPKKTTNFQPFRFKEKVQQCLEQRKRLVIFYDEMNRADSITQSAVFDAISNNRILGVDITELVKNNLISFVAAGNVGPGYEVQELDAASVARFAFVRKDHVDDGDWNSFMKFAAKVFSPEFVEVLEKSKNHVMNALNADPTIDSDGNPGGEVNIASKFTSLRTFESLDTILKTNNGFLISFAPEKYIDDSLVIDVVDNPMYLGWQYGDTVKVSINGVVMTLTDLLHEVKNFNAGETENSLLDLNKSGIYKEVVSTIREADMTLYKYSWRYKIEASLNLKTPGFSSMLQELEKTIATSKGSVKYTINDMVQDVLLVCARSGARRDVIFNVISNNIERIKPTITKLSELKQVVDTVIDEIKVGNNSEALGKINDKLTIDLKNAINIPLEEDIDIQVTSNIKSTIVSGLDKALTIAPDIAIMELLGVLPSNEPDLFSLDRSYTVSINYGQNPSSRAGKDYYMQPANPYFKYNLVALFPMIAHIFANIDVVEMDGCWPLIPAGDCRSIEVYDMSGFIDKARQAFSANSSGQGNIAVNEFEVKQYQLNIPDNYILKAVDLSGTLNMNQPQSAIDTFWKWFGPTTADSLRGANPTIPINTCILVFEPMEGVTGSPIAVMGFMPGGLMSSEKEAMQNGMIERTNDLAMDTRISRMVDSDNEWQKLIQNPNQFNAGYGRATTLFGAGARGLTATLAASRTDIRLIGRMIDRYFK